MKLDCIYIFEFQKVCKNLTFQHLSPRTSPVYEATAMSTRVLFYICILIISSFDTIKSQSTNETESTCFSVISAYNESQLIQLCVDPNEFDIEIVSQTCADCDNNFYGAIATSTDLDYLWVLVAGAMVFFMQTGFTMLEAGSVKIGNVQNILFKNLMDACVGAIGFYLFGYAVAYGDGTCSINGFMGCNNVALSSVPVEWNSFFFQWAFAATAATIVSGSVAERCSLSGYFLYTSVLSIWVYPVIVHWFWSGSGWLSPFNDSAYFAGGVIDFAGSGVVHMVGGWSGLCGAVMLGARLNRWDKMKPQSTSPQAMKHWEALKSQHTLGNNVPFQVLGTFILWFGWYGFNPGSTLGANGLMEIASKAAVTSTLAASGGGIAAATVGRVLEGYFSLPRVCNGILAGLVSITAPCSVVDTGDALAIGVIGALVYYTASRFLERIKVDDPLDAWAVHGCGGMWGVISVALFASSENIAFAGYNETLVNASKGYRLGLQMFAVFIIVVWTVFWIGGLFWLLTLCGQLRVPDDVERAGLDQSEHGGGAVDYKRGYVIKDRKTRAAMSVFGRGERAGSGSTSQSNESDDEEEEKETAQQTGTVQHLSSGNSMKRRLRPQATPHIRKFPKDAPKAHSATQLPTINADSTIEDDDL
eukprot:40833_1